MYLLHGPNKEVILLGVFTLKVKETSPMQNSHYNHVFFFNLNEDREDFFLRCNLFFLDYQVDLTLKLERLTKGAMD